MNQNAITFNNSTLTRGYMIALVSAAILSTTAILIRHLTQTYHIPPLVLTFWRDGFVALALLPVLGLLHPLLLRVKRQHLLYLIAYGFVLAIFGLYNVSLGYLPSSVANLILTLEPAFTAVIAYVLLGECLNEMQIVGSVLILTGVIFLRVYEGWLSGQTQPEPPRKIQVASME